MPDKNGLPTSVGEAILMNQGKGSSWSANDLWGGLSAAGHGIGLTKDAPQMGTNPYQSQWDALLAQLRDQANGIGPSVAQQQYKQAEQQAMGNMISLSHSRGPGAARLATQGMTQIGEGETSGLALAKTQEMMAAKAAYEQALAAASGQQQSAAQFNAQMQANTPTQGQQVMGEVAQVAAVIALMNGKKPPTSPAGPGGTGVGSNPTDMTGMTQGQMPGGIWNWAQSQNPQGMGMPGYAGTTPGYAGTPLVSPYSQSGTDNGYFGGMSGY